MPLFPQPEQDSEQDKIIAQLVHRLNDVDRRLRVAEQIVDNGKVNANNLNENFVNHQKETDQRLSVVQQKTTEMEKRLGAIETKMTQLLSEIRGMPKTKAVAAPIHETKTEAVPEEVETDLDSALSTLEKHTGTLEDELK